MGLKLKILEYEYDLIILYEMDNQQVRPFLKCFRDYTVDILFKIKIK